MQKLVCPRGGVWRLSFSPDGDLLLGIGPGVVYCWMRSREWEPSGLRHPLHQIAGAVFHPSGLALVYGLAPGQRPVVQISTEDDQFAGFAGVRLYSLTGENLFDPDRLLVTGGNFMPFPHNWVAGVAFTPDGQTLIANQFEERGFFSRAMPIILHWHFAPSGNQWKVADTTPIRTEAENGAALIGNAYVVFAGNWGVRLCPLDASAVGPLHVPVVSRSQSVAVAPRGELVATYESGTLSVWNLRNTEPIATWLLSSIPLEAMAFSPDGDTLAISDSEFTVAFYDPVRGRKAEYDFDVGQVQSLTYAPDGLTLAVAGKTGLVVVDVD